MISNRADLQVCFRFRLFLKETGVWRWIILCICLLVALESPAGPALGLQPVNLRSDYRENPPGVDQLRPQLSWTLQANDSARRNLSQSAFQVLVATRKELLVLGRADIWDSGQIESDKMANVVFGGQSLQSSRQYWWMVRVWDQDRLVSDWSKPAAWSMGLLAKEDWKAKWITSQKATSKSGPLPLFRRQFSVEKRLARAVVYVCGLGAYEMSINGRKVGDLELDPGWTNYRKTCLYSTYDVTDLVQNGSNVVGVMLGNGMYNVAGGRYAKFTGSFGPLQLIAQIRLEFADGTVTEIGTDKDWKSISGPIMFSCIYGGEDHDARAELSGWEGAGFDDSTWSTAIETEGPGGKLVAQSAPPIQVVREFKPVKISEPRPGVFVYDLGQNFSGRPAMKVKGPAGAEVKFIPGELLNKDGLVEQGWSGSPVWFKYTLKGSQEERWHPRFSYYGFRYVQVEGAIPINHNSDDGRKPVLLELTGQFTRSSAAVVGHFECSSSLINRIHALILGAIESNMQSVITDCPHREKLGWLEVSHLLGRAVMFNFDTATLWRKICQDTTDSQLENGLVPDIAPEYTVFEGPFRDSPEWGSASVLNPWLLYQYYGDDLVLREQYEVMRRYVGYLGSRATNHIISYGLGDWCDVGPNVAGESQLTSKGVTATAIYFQNIEVLRNVAKLLNRSEDVAYWEALGRKVRAAFNKEFFNPTTNTYDRGSQTASAMPLVLGIVDPSRKAAVVKQLVDNVRSGTNRVTAGDIGFRYLVEALRANNKSEVIYDLVTQNTGPGYAMQLAKGATTLTETWDASIYSRNHCMLGHAEEWFYTGLAGINPDSFGPGFRRVLIAPQPVGDLTWAKGSYNSISGRIESSWRIANGQFHLDVVIPVNTKAAIRMPVANESLVTEGGVPATKAKGVKFVGSENGGSTFEVGSGFYAFKSPILEQTSE